MALTSGEIAQARKRLNSKSAKWLEGQMDLDTPLQGDQEAVRGWKLTASDKAPMLLEFLKVYTDATNTNPLTYIDNPLAQDNQYDGRYRQAYAKRIKNEANEIWLIQVLRLGFLEDFSDDEWRLQTGSTIPITESLRLIRRLPHVNPEFADDMLVARRTVTSVDDPYADGEQYTGKFAVSEVRSDKDEDGSITFTETLTELNEVEDIDDLSALSPRVLQKNEILELFGFDEGEGDYLAYMWDEMDPEDQDNLMNIPDASLVSDIAGAGWTYADRKFEVKKDGTAGFTVAFRAVNWTNIQTVSGRKEIARDVLTQRGSVEGHGMTWGRLSRGVPADDADEAGSWIRPDTNGAIQGVSLREGADGERMIMVQQGITFDYSSPSPWASPTDYKCGDIVSESGNDYICTVDHTSGTFATDLANGRWTLTSTNPTILKEVEAVDTQKSAFTYIWRRVSKERIEAIWTVADTYGVGGSYVLNYRDRIDNGDGTANIISGTVIPRYSSGSVPQWDNFEHSFTYTEAKWRRIKDSNGDPTDEVRFFTSTYHVLQTGSRTAAYAFPNSDSKHPVWAKVEIYGKGRYRAKCITQSCTAWTDDNGAYSDIGNQT